MLRACSVNMLKDALLSSQPKGVYRLKNWPEYNAGLIEQENMTVWMDERMFSPALQTPSQRGCPQTYCKGIIQMLPTPQIGVPPAAAGA